MSDPTPSTTSSAADNASYTLENVKANVANTASSAYNAVANHPVAQDLKHSVANGPVAENIKDQSAKTSAEFQDLANSRTRPAQPAATGQPLTHYHSLFYNLLSWKNPRATAISYVGAVTLILAARYLPLLRWTFKGSFYLLLATASAEILGQKLFSSGLTSSIRPRRYYTIPRETLEASTEDLEHLINFFVIEIQRVIFAERVTVTLAAFIVSAASWGLVKLLPFWGLCLTGVSALYLLPLIYVTNQELIDENIAHISNTVNAQVHQVSDLAATHTSNATSAVKDYANTYAGKAQEYIDSARGTVSPQTTGATSPQTTGVTSPQTTGAVSATGPTSGPGNPPAYLEKDFPHAPKQEPAGDITTHQDQYESSHLGGSALPAQ